MLQNSLEDVVPLLYEAVERPEAWQTAFELLSRSLGVDCWTLMRFGGEAHVISAGGDRIGPGAAERYESHFGAIDPRVPLMAHSGAGRMVVCRDQLDERLVSRSEFFQDFLLPEGLRWTLGGCVHRAGDEHYVVGLMRGADRSLFNENEVRQVEGLARHCQVVLRLTERVRGLSEQVEAAEVSLGTTALAAFAIDGRGRVGWQNRRAEGLLRSGRFVRTRDGCLVFTEHEVQVWWLSALARMGRMREPCSTLVGTPNGGRESITVMPLRSSAFGFDAANVRGLCLLSPADHARVATVRQLCDALDLTPAEARLARALADGSSLEEYAGAAGTQLSTVKSQLQAAMRKTGSRRQISLVRLIASVPPVRHKIERC